MSLTINGPGNAYSPDQRRLAKQKRRARPPPAFPEVSEKPARDWVDGAWFPEQFRAEVAAISQAIEANENAAAIVDAARAAMSQISAWLALMENEAEQAAGLHEMAGADPSRAAHQQKLAEIRGWIEQLAETAHFGRLRLLDGGLGCTGMAFGEGLGFVSASPRVRSSPPEGYPVWVSRMAVRAHAVVELPRGRASPGVPPWLAIETGGIRAEHEPYPGESSAEVAAALRLTALRLGLEVLVTSTRGGGLLIRHQRYGSAHEFTLRGSVPGVFSMADGGPITVCNGVDVAGSINGEPAFGEGQLLTGHAGNRTSDGLSVRFSGVLPNSGGNRAPPENLTRLGLEPEPGEGPEGHQVGRVIVAQQPMVFRMGGKEREAIVIRLNSMKPSQLGLGAETAGGVLSLAEVGLGEPSAAADARKVIRRAVEETDCTVAELELLSGSVLPEILADLRWRAEQKRAFYTNIGDAGLAREAAFALRGEMKTDAHLALMAQVQPLPGAMMRLLTGEPEPGHSQLWA